MATLHELVEEYLRPGGPLERAQLQELTRILEEYFTHEEDALIGLCQKFGIQPSEWPKLSVKQKLIFLQRLTGKTYGDEEPDSEEQPDAEILTADSPEACEFQHNGKWLTAALAFERFGLSKQQMHHAATKPKPPHGMRIERRVAQVAAGKSGVLLVFHAGQTKLLAEKVDTDE